MIHLFLVDVWSNRNLLFIHLFFPQQYVIVGMSVGLLKGPEEKVFTIRQQQGERQVSWEFSKVTCFTVFSLFISFANFVFSSKYYTAHLLISSHYLHLSDLFKADRLLILKDIVVWGYLYGFEPRPPNIINVNDIQ